MDNDAVMEAIGATGFTASDLKYDEAVEKLINQLREETFGKFYDAISGEVLNGVLIKKAREAEMETFKKNGVYEKVLLEERWRVTGKALLAVKWVDANRGDEEKPEYRCRLVAKEIKRDKREDLFAATPPLDAKMVLCSLLASTPEMRLDFINAVRAYFLAKARRDAYVDLLQEDHQEDMRGKLKKAM